MAKKYIFEDTRLPKLFVGYTDKIQQQIDDIVSYNKGNNNLSQWLEYIDSLLSYIGNPVIAWDNTGKYIKKNDTTHVKELGYDVQFKIETDNNNKNFVEIVKLSYNLKKFGLQSPPSLTESKSISKNKTIRLNNTNLKSKTLSDNQFVNKLNEVFINIGIIYSTHLFNYWGK